jgi:hypothetical protein
VFIAGIVGLSMMRPAEPSNRLSVVTLIAISLRGSSMDSVLQAG